MSEYGNFPGAKHGGGVVVFVGPPVLQPCEPLRLAWIAAQRACDEAQERAKAAREEQARDQAELEELDDRYGWDLGGADQGLEFEGEGWTSIEDLRMLEQLANEAFARYRANPSPETAREAQQAGRQRLTPEVRDRLRRERDQARARMDQLRQEIAESQAIIDEAARLCAEAAQAKKAYEACIGAHSAPPPVPPPPPPPSPPVGGPATDTGGGAPKPDEPEKPTPPPDDPRDARGDDPRDVSPCPPGSEEWQRCGDKVEYFDWQRDDVTVRLEIRPAVGSVYGWLQTWSRGYSAPAASQSFECDVPQRALEIDLYRNSPQQTASSMFRDLNAIDMLHKTWFVSIRATFTYVRSGWVCERRCQDGKWMFRAVEVGRREMTRVIEPEPFLNSTDPGANTAAIARMLKPIGEFAAALYVDYLNQDSFQVSCRQGVVCAGGWERAGLDDVAKPRR